MQKLLLSAIVAIGKNRAIGKNNQLLWHIPEDLKRFKTLTLGHPVIMGRKTFDSILAQLGKPLPGRTNIVVTRDTNWRAEGATVAHTLEEAVGEARVSGADEAFIIGGSQIYEQALPMTDRLYLTLIDDEQEGDAYFPAYEELFTKKIFEEAHEHGGLGYRWITLERT